MADAPTATGANESIHNVIEPLHRAKFWMQLVGVLSIIFGALQTLGALGMLVKGHMIALIPGLIMAVVMIWIGLVLMGAASAIERGYRHDDSHAVSDGMDRLKTYFTIIGVLALIGIVVSVLGIVVAVSMGFGAIMST
jgi:hypothetical protein